MARASFTDDKSGNEGATAKFVISSGETILLSPEDLPRVSPHQWYLWEESGRFSVVAHLRGEKGHRRVRLAKFLLNPPPGLRAMRVPGAHFLDFRRCVLFVGNLSEQKRRAGKTKGDFTSRYKGVYRFEDRWRAFIVVDRKFHCLGFFAQEEAAARAYDQAALRHFGENAFRNQV